MQILRSTIELPKLTYKMEEVMECVNLTERWKISRAVKSDPIVKRINCYSDASIYIMQHLDKLMTDVLDVNPVRPYLILYSVFSERDKYKRDWIETFMIRYLGLEEDELRFDFYPPEPPEHIMNIVRKMMPEHKVPVELMEKLSGFDPAPVQFEMEPIYITYKFRSYEPIKVEDWNFIPNQLEEVVNVKEEIQKFDVIHL